MQCNQCGIDDSCYDSLIDKVEALEKHQTESRHKTIEEVRCVIKSYLKRDPFGRARNEGSNAVIYRLLTELKEKEK